MTLDDLEALERALEGKLNHWKLASLFPDEGPLRRELYVKHLAFFAAGATYRERMFMAGNRVGKTVAGGYETVLHLTGRYTHWWQGRRFDEPVRWWAAGSTKETTRDIVQAELMGAGEAYGTGLIPYDDIVDVVKRPNSGGALDYVKVRHKSADGKTVGESLLGFKSYDQGRRAFEGTAKHGVWLDEEPPLAIYTECLTRTATTKGLMMVTFTPLNGATDVVMDYIENADLVG